MATPAQLIRDKTRTPFNIGQAIQLNGFQLHEVEPLAQGLVGEVDNPRAVLKEILTWTGGQPFLTQKLCRLVTQSGELSEWEEEMERISDFQSPFMQQLVQEILMDYGELSVRLSALVESRIIKNWESQDEPEHLRTIRDRLLKNKQQAVGLLELYRQILQQGEVVAVDGSEQMELLLSGLVVKQQGKLRVHNRIYASIFNSRWIEQTLAQLAGVSPFPS